MFVSDEVVLEVFDHLVSILVRHKMYDRYS